MFVKIYKLVNLFSSIAVYKIFKNDCYATNVPLSSIFGPQQPWRTVPICHCTRKNKRGVINLIRLDFQRMHQIANM